MRPYWRVGVRNRSLPTPPPLPPPRKGPIYVTGRRGGSRPPVRVTPSPRWKIRYSVFPLLSLSLFSPGPIRDVPDVFPGLNDWHSPFPQTGQCHQQTKWTEGVCPLPTPVRKSSINMIKKYGLRAEPWWTPTLEPEPRVSSCLDPDHRVVMHVLHHPDTLWTSPASSHCISQFRPRCYPHPPIVPTILQVVGWLLFQKLGYFKNVNIER